MYIVIIGNVFPKRNYLALAGILIGLGQVSSGYVCCVFELCLSIVFKL